MKSDLMEAAEMLRDFAGDIERQKIPRWTHAEIVQLAERLESLPAPDDMDFIDTAPEFTRDGMYRALVSEKLPAPGEAVACKFPRMKIALFDEFGLGADDRVMDYGRECFEAGQSSYATAPPQVTDAMVEAACAAFSDYWGTMSPGGKLLAIKSMRKALEAAHAARGG